MNKIKFFLLACSWLLGAILLLAHPANAAEIVGQIADQVLSVPSEQTVNVLSDHNHYENSLPKLAAKDKINSIHQSGCNCSACQDPFSLLQGRLPS